MSLPVMTFDLLRHLSVHLFPRTSTSIHN